MLRKLCIFWIRLKNKEENKNKNLKKYTHIFSEAVHVLSANKLKRVIAP